MKGSIFCHYLEHQYNVNKANYYKKIWLFKQCELKRKGVIIKHLNAHPHVATKIQDIYDYQIKLGNLYHIHDTVLIWYHWTTTF